MLSLWYYPWVNSGYPDLNQPAVFLTNPGVRKLLRHCGGKTRHVIWKLIFAQESWNCVVVRSRGADRLCRLSVDHRNFTRIDVDESFKCRNSTFTLKHSKFVLFIFFLVLTDKVFSRSCRARSCLNYKL